MKSVAEQGLAEFIGAFALVFIGAGSVVIAAYAVRSSPESIVFLLVGIALAHALVLGVMVSNLGHISGGHFNPAVTIAVWSTRKIESGRAAAYIVAQLAGAVAGAGLLRLIMPEAVWKPGTLGATLLNADAGMTTSKGVMLEAVLTFFLVFTVFATAVDDRGVFKSIAGLSIGFVLGFDILVGGLLTGASMNPARSFGPALVAGTWTDFWVYVLGPVFGGLVAALVYWFGFLRLREVFAPRSEQPIGGGPEEDLDFDES
jgi:MIP family channel proteins